MASHAVHSSLGELGVPPEILHDLANHLLCTYNSHFVQIVDRALKATLWRSTTSTARKPVSTPKKAVYHGGDGSTILGSTHLGIHAPGPITSRTYLTHLDALTQGCGLTFLGFQSHFTPIEWPSTQLSWGSGPDAVIWIFTKPTWWKDSTKL